MPKPRRDKVFISYAHVDQSETDWLSKLKLYLGLFERKGTVDLWDDTRIDPGDKWREQIKEALHRAKVAVLLVGPGFLQSKFIAEKELPPLLDAAESEGVRVFPLVVGYCAYRSSELEPFEAVNDPDKPLEALPRDQQNKILRDVSDAVNDAFNSPTAPTQPNGGPLGRLQNADSGGQFRECIRRIRMLDELSEVGLDDGLKIEFQRQIVTQWLEEER